MNYLQPIEISTRADCRVYTRNKDLGCAVGLQILETNGFLYGG